MLLQSYIPDDNLRQYIDKMVYYSGYSAPSSFERILPDGMIQLCIALDSNVRVMLNSDKTHNPLQKAWITGVQQVPVTYVGEQKACSLFIQFTPVGCCACLGIPANELTNSTIDAAAILGKEIHYLGERLFAHKNIKDIFSEVEKFFSSRINESPVEHAVINYVSDGLRRKGEMDYLVNKSGFSHKHVIHIFKKHVGVTPKIYQRIIRFNQALKYVRKEKSTDWISLCHQLGFYDQAHLINDFKTFAGFTPKEYLLRVGEYPNVLAMNTI